MRGLVATLGLVAGCADIFDLVSVAAPDANTDASTDENDSCAFGRFGRYGTGGSGLLDICLTMQPAGQRDLGANIDTSVAGTCSIELDPVGQPPVCVILAVDITIPATIRVIGSRPLVLVATNSIAIAGALDVSSGRGMPTGAGNGHPTCSDLLAGQAVSTAVASAGGAGGSYQTLGGTGGDGDAAQTMGGDPDLDTTSLTRIAGGCRGGNGGSASPPGSGGGAGGGAIYLIAGNTIVMANTGLINTSGAAGAGGRAGINAGAMGSGGAGGGAGGLVGLDAPMIMLAANSRLIANGGGGGGGGGSFGGANGTDGASPDASIYPFGGKGGDGATQGGSGGTAQAAAAGGANGTSTQAGAGGGGGTGFIKIYTTQLTDSGVLASPAYN